MDPKLRAPCPGAGYHRRVTSHAGPGLAPPLVSVCLVTHNGRRWLPGCLESLRRQDLERWERVIKAAGVSTLRLFRPVAMVAVVVMAVTAVLTLVVIPLANFEFQRQLFRILQARATSGLAERVFNPTFGDVIVYVEDVSASQVALRGLLVSDERDAKISRIITAREGRLLTDEENRWLYVPVAGPWIALGDTSDENGDSDRWLLAFDGIAQAAGVVMLAGSWIEARRERYTTRHIVRWTVTPRTSSPSSRRTARLQPRNPGPSTPKASSRSWPARSLRSCSRCSA